MNGLRADGLRLARDIAAGAAEGQGGSACDLLVCPPATLVAEVAEALGASKALGASVAAGGQDCHAAPRGAHTGEVSAEMLADLGCRYVIVGHSERRADHGETDGQVRAKAGAALRAGLTAIVCIGESAEQRDAGQALEVVERQLAGSLPPSSPTNRFGRSARDVPRRPPRWPKFTPPSGPGCAVWPRIQTPCEFSTAGR